MTRENMVFLQDELDEDQSYMSTNTHQHYNTEDWKN